MRPPLRRALATIALGIGLLTACARPIPPAQTHDVLQDALRASVQIVVERNGAPLRWGSGVAIAAHATECLVLTAGHTLTGLQPGDVVFALLGRHGDDATKARAKLIAAEDTASWDLALVTIQSGACVAAHAGTPPRLGDAIWVVGFPHGGEMTVGRGIVSQVTRAAPGVPSRFTIDASTSHGSSGAGVFDSRTGHLIGLVEAFGTARVEIRGDAANRHIDIPMPGMTYVTPVNKIDEFLRAASGDRRLTGRR
jgi:S1-C subfamily serine protease